MREAIELAVRSVRRGMGGPFGALVVRKGKVVGRGWNRVTSANDPTAHAEIVAIRAACRRLGAFRLSDCELYASSEPCPMCLSAIYWARIPRVYCGGTHRDAARAGFDDERIGREVARPARRRGIRMEPLLRAEALVAFAEWRRKSNKVPY